MLRMKYLGQREIQKNNDVYRVSQAAKTLARLVLEARKRMSVVTGFDLNMV